jgi:hypothetical protein
LPVATNNIDFSSQTIFQDICQHKPFILVFAQPFIPELATGRPAHPRCAKDLPLSLTPVATLELSRKSAQTSRTDKPRPTSWLFCALDFVPSILCPRGSELNQTI